MAGSVNIQLPVLRPAAIAGSRFDLALAGHGIDPLTRGVVETVQINVGRVCNQACHHCHVDAGPKRTESMPLHVAQRIIGVLVRSPQVRTVDITGGAPELNPHFRYLVGTVRRMGRHLIDRCNLTVLFEPGMEDLPEFLAENRVEIVASLPCYLAENVDKQRGAGVFTKSIEALQWLNRLGYGREGSDLQLNLVYNPIGPTLPPAQPKLEADYKRELRARFGIEFNRLFTITNMPIKRFAEDLARQNQLETYMGLLANHFNSTAVPGVMCRSLVSIGWTGGLYDCDFNQMLDMGLADGDPAPITLWDIESFAALAGKRIATGSHCFGCTAGAGSSCAGAIR